jgi:hypothetical protein
MEVGRVTFEYVSPFQYPQAYSGSKSTIHPNDIPEEWWILVVTVKPICEARSQYEGLLEQMRDGELIRNPKLSEGTQKVTFTPKRISNE